MAETKAAFRRRVGRLLNILRTGTTSSSGDTDTFIALGLTDHYGTDNALNGAAVYDVTGAEWRRVTAWLGTTGEGTVNRAFTASQASGRSIEIYEQFTPDDLDDALRMALDEAYPYVVTRVVDNSLTVIASQYEYTVPTTIRDLTRIRGGRVLWEVNETDATYPYADFDIWETRYSGSAQALILPYIDGKVGRTIRLIGWGVPTFPSTDATSIDLESDTLQLLALKTAEIAWRTGPRLSGRDAEFAQQMSAYFMTQYEAKKDVWGVEMKPSRMQRVAGVPYTDYPLAYNHTPDP